MTRWTTLLAFLLISACAGEPLTEEEQYAREDARAVRIDTIQAYIRGCEYAGGMIVKTSHGATKRNRDGSFKITYHDRINDFQCVSQSAISDAIRGGW